MFARKDRDRIPAVSAAWSKLYLWAVLGTIYFQVIGQGCVYIIGIVFGVMGMNIIYEYRSHSIMMGTRKLRKTRDVFILKYAIYSN